MFLFPNRILVLNFELTRTPSTDFFFNLPLSFCISFRLQPDFSQGDPLLVGIREVRCGMKSWTYKNCWFLIAFKIYKFYSVLVVTNPINNHRVQLNAVMALNIIHHWSLHMKSIYWSFNDFLSMRFER